MLDDWFVVSMSILLPLIVVLGIAAFVPLPHEWKSRHRKEE